MEYSRRLLRLREFRLRRLLRPRRLFDRRHAQASSAADPAPGPGRRRGVGRRRSRNGLSDAAAARRILRHRHACARRRAADAGRQLGLCRRLARRLYRTAGNARSVRPLYQISVHDHAAACRRRGDGRAADRALAPRLRLRHHPRRRTRRRSLRGPDASAQARCHHDLGRAHGHGRRAVPVLHRLPAAVLGVRPRLRGQLDRDAADRRHDQLGRSADRRRPAWLAAADRDGDDLVRRQPADRRLPPRRLRHHRAQRHRRAGAPYIQHKPEDFVGRRKVEADAPEHAP